MSTIDTDQIGESDLLAQNYDNLNNHQANRKEDVEKVINPNVEVLILLRTLLTKNTNLVESASGKLHTCPITPEIFNTINSLNKAGLTITSPKAGQTSLNLDEIAQMKQEINEHLEEIGSETANTSILAVEENTSLTAYENNQFSSSRETAKPVDPDLELFGVQTSKPKTVNLAHEFLHKAALPKLDELHGILEGHSIEIKDINKCREALLDIKRELVKYTEEEDKTKKHELDELILEKIAFLEEKNIKLIDHLDGTKELSLTQLMELKEQIASQTSKLQFDQQTLFTTKIGPDFNTRHIMLEIAKLVVRIDNQMMSALIQNQKVNG